ncbi:hypothetical protein BH23CHL8_BH23CHL8_13950 [soil metagenome]
MSDQIEGRLLSAPAVTERPLRIHARLRAAPLLRLWVILGAAAIGVYLLLPMTPAKPIFYDVLALAAAGTVALAVIIRHRRPRLPWILLAGGIALSATGEVVYDLLAAGGPVSEPSLADAFYLGGYAAICVALATLLLRGRRALVALLDAFVIGSAVGIVLWTLVVDPRIDEGALALSELAIVAAYPALDLAMLSILIAALLAGRAFDLTAGLLAAAAAAFLASDLAYAVVAATSEYAPGIIDLGWLTGYVLWGAAALAVPIRVHRRQQAFPGRAAWSTLRPYVLLGAAVTPLLMAFGEHVWWGRADALAAAVTSVVISIGVIVRLELVIRQQGRLLEDRRRLETSLLRQASEDPLTELPNRRGLADWLAMALADEHARPALMVLDLDDFKAVNDSLGHPAGDALLRAVAERLHAAVRGTDTVARLGGDEFAVVLAPCPSVDVAEAMAERLLRSLDEPIITARGRISVTGSIGIAIADGPEATAESLLRDADIALYRAKEAGKNRWVLLDVASRATALRALSIASELARAVADQELELEFQPIVSLTTGGIDALEALIRWRHPTLGPLLPSEFLAAAERSVHMEAIGRWVLDEACAAAASWPRSGSARVGVSVNISTAQLADDRFPDVVLAALERAGLAAHLLTLEILEAALDATPGIGERLARIREAGVRLAIDDFGTGYSALSRVTEIPVNELKLDRSLVAGLHDTPIASAIVRLGQTLGLRLVAEGVETEAELDHVRSLGCDAAQGYRISRPVPAADVAALLSSWPSLPQNAGRAPRPLPSIAI